MAPNYYYLTVLGLVLLSVFSTSSTHAVPQCHDCAPKVELRETIGIDFSIDALTMVVQHINGTFETLAVRKPGFLFKNYMDWTLRRAEIHPYGYGDNRPNLSSSNGTDSYYKISNDFVIDIIHNEIVRLFRLNPRNVRYYSVSTPSFFPSTLETQVITAFQRVGFPHPVVSVTYADAAFAVLSPSSASCLLSDFNCKPRSDLRNYLLLELSDSVLSGTLYSMFDMGRRFTRVAYFTDAGLGYSSWRERTYNDKMLYLAATKRRIKDLIEDHRDHNAQFSPPPPFDVVVLGDAASDRDFGRALREVVAPYKNAAILPPLTLDGNILDPLFTLAEGAAKMTKLVIEIKVGEQQAMERIDL